MNNLAIYAQAVGNLYPDGNFSFIAPNYDGLIWEDERAKPTQQEVEAEFVKVKEQDSINNCKAQASKLLYETDWTTIPDVADPSNSPYLTNQADFIAWRAQIRALAVNPVADPIFPKKPDEVWG